MLPHALLGQGINFRENIAHPAAAIGPANQGNGAVGAAVGAAVAQAGIGGIAGGGEHALLLEFMPDGEISSLNCEAEALRRIIE